MIHYITFFISDLDSPVVVVTPSTTVNESSPLTFTCSSIGSGSLAYTWTKDGKSHRSSTSQISIVSASRGDAGNYMCTVTNNFGAKHSTVYKIVVNCKYLCPSRKNKLTNLQTDELTN